MRLHAIRYLFDAKMQKNAIFKFQVNATRKLINF